VRAWGRIRRALWGIGQEVTWAKHYVKRGRSAYLVNVLAYRLLLLTSRVPGRDREYFLETISGLSLFYRRNRGDIQGIREILIDEIYRLPAGAAPTSLVDLGANIGLATVWICHEYSVTDFVAVEPLVENFALLQKNCTVNELNGQLVNSAIGPKSGTTTFNIAGGSNMGRVGTGNLTVPVVGIDELLGDINFQLSLLKMDVEGMEKDLLVEVDPKWIAGFNFIVMEMHPEYVDIASLVNVISAQNFTYFEPVEFTKGLHRSKRERLFVHNPCTVTR
jgi:FkbM family methyltransferase